MATLYTTNDGDRLDLICYRNYGTLSGRMVEQVLEANQDLAQHPIEIPAGVVVTLPDLSDSFVGRQYIPLGFD